MKKIFAGIAAVLFFLSAHAQFRYDYLRAADGYFQKGDYYSAAQYYEKYLGTAKDKDLAETYNPYVVKSSSKKTADVPVSNKQQAVYNAAESYRMISYHEKAEPFYEQARSFDRTAFPLVLYWHAATKRALGKYAEAEQAFRAFLDEYQTADMYREAAGREIANLQFIQSELNKKDLHLYTVNKKGNGLIDTGALYAPTWLDAGTLVFTSTKEDDESEKKNAHANRIYQASYINGELTALSKMDIPQPGEWHQGAAAFAPDGNTIYFTRWTVGEGKKSASIFSSNRTGNTWSEPVAVDAINVAGSNTQQPFVMPGGKYLLFSSDRPGGNGGYDLWYASLEGPGRAGAPVNMGTVINTAFDEQAPYYHEPSGSLVFSSNGRTGMGGFDFFHVKGNIPQWQEVKNFGYPVNSIKDDIYFTSRSTGRNILEEALISSDRAAACCLQLFSVSKPRPQLQIRGSVVVCDTRVPAEGAILTIIDTTTNKVVYTKTTDAGGQYSFSIDEFLPLKATATLAGHHPGSLAIPSPADDETFVLNNPEICVARIPVVGTVEVLENVYFEFNKARILEESEAALNKLVDLMNQNPEMVIEIGGHTDSKGNDEYNRRLSEARAQSVVQYLISKGISKERLQSKGYGESQPVAPNENPDGSDNPEGREKNRRTEFKVLKN